jgi:hypothetical protein
MNSEKCRDLITITLLDFSLYDRVGKVEVPNFLESPNKDAEPPIIDLPYEQIGLMRLGCFFNDSILCLNWKPDGCEEFGRIKIVLPGLINDPDLVMTISLFVGYLLV